MDEWMHGVAFGCFLVVLSYYSFDWSNAQVNLVIAHNHVSRSAAPYNADVPGRGFM